MYKRQAEYLQLVGGMHGIGGNTIAEDGGVDQIAGQLRDGIVQVFGIGAVSYTHLDVYKRQV